MRIPVTFTFMCTLALAAAALTFNWQLGHVSAQAPARFVGPTSSQTLALSARSSARNGERRIGTLTIVAGRTDRERYLLLSKLTVIGRSQMATVRLRRWFAPQTAASIHHREDGYFLAAAGKKTKLRINGTEMMKAHQELNPGDAIEVAGITATFDYEVLPVNPIDDTPDSLDK